MDRSVLNQYRGSSFHTMQLRDTHISVSPLPDWLPSPMELAWERRYDPAALAHHTIMPELIRTGESRAGPGIRQR